MKTVCIIGAGPAGLVAAKTLLQTKKFVVKICEQNDKVGGIWAFAPNAVGNGYLGTSTRGNLSRHTMAFSDLSWKSLKWNRDRMPVFVTAETAGIYLETYRQRYIPDGVICFNCKIIKVSRVSKDGRAWWEVATSTRDGYPITETFDYLVNAAGFHGEARIPSLPGSSISAIPQVHTSQYRSLDDLFPDQDVDIHGKTILVYGSGNSSAETANHIAYQISSSHYSSNPSSRDKFSNTTVCHVTPHAVHAIPPFVPSGSGCATFVPLDCQFYDLKWRPPEPVISDSGFFIKEKSQAVFAAMHGMVGDQSDLGSSALLADQATAPFAVLCESYPEFVRCGAISPIAGRLKRLDGGGENGSVTARVHTANGAFVSIDNIAAVIHATGYTPNASVELLPQVIKETLEYDPSCSRLPILLQQYQTINPAVPDLAFIGFYEGPYWPVMEMQARGVAARWADGHIMPELPDENLDKLRALRTAIKAGDQNVPQYWFSDYVGYMEEIAHELGLKRLNTPFEHDRHGPVSAARYLNANDDEVEAISSMKDLKDTLDEALRGRYRARAAFRALQGNWQVQRAIDSSGPGLPSGLFIGCAHFHPRIPSNPEADMEYLYIETGTFSTESGLRMSASRRYVYRYREATDTLSVWFVKPEDETSTDYLFHDLSFNVVEKGMRCTASAEHLCDEDLYITEYTFEFRTVALAKFEIRHHVKGPQKDYIARAQYTR